MNVKYALGNNGYIVTQDNGSVISVPLEGSRFSSDVQEWIALGNTVEPADSVDMTVPNIKAMAQQRIITLTSAGEYWREKQANMTARFTELLYIVVSGGSLTSEEDAEKNELLAFWDKVKAIRNYSDSLEQDHANGETIEVEAGTSATHVGGWPY